jgi:hypothetical protein
MGGWAQNLEGADILVNLTGRSVNCRYNSRNRRGLNGLLGCVLVGILAVALSALLTFSIYAAEDAFDRPSTGCGSP